MAKALAESDATADQMELDRALMESQEDELQRAIKESKLSTEHVRTWFYMATMVSVKRFCCADEC